MKKQVYILAFLTSFTATVNAQNVGINTDGSNPDGDAILHINNHSGSTLDSSIIRIENEQNGVNDVTGLEIYNSGTGATAKWDVYIPASGSTDLRFKNNGTDRITIQNDGDVGIGTTSPTAKLDVDGSAIFNESGAAEDFRIESGANTHQFYVDGTNNEIGVNTSTPASTIDIQGSMGLKVTTITSATTLDQTHNVVLCNTGPYTVNLPAAATNTGKIYYIKNIDATNRATIYIDANINETIDGQLIFTLNSYNSAIRIICDGTNWHVLETSGTIQNHFDLRNCDGSVFTWNDVVTPTGRTWMDRNLGALQVATSSTDALSYGDAYQWGRGKDGHQCRNSAISPNTSDTDIPGHGDIILSNANTDGSQDWRTTRNHNLWQGVSGTNNPCPEGYRVPTVAEFLAERNEFTTFDNAGALAYPLAFSLSGGRCCGTMNELALGVWALYWTSTVSGNGARRWAIVNNFARNSGDYRPRSDANTIRCIKD